jgi:hypothetical protein
MKKNTAIRLASREAQIDILRVLLPLIPYPVMVQENGRIILSNPAWDGSENPDVDQMQEIIIFGSEGDDVFTIYVLPSETLVSPGHINWEQSAQELKSALSSLVEGVRKSLPQPTSGDPLADVKHEYNAALETIEKMISVSRLF